MKRSKSSKDKLVNPIAEEAKLVRTAFKKGKMDNEKLDPPDVFPVKSVGDK